MPHIKDSFLRDVPPFLSVIFGRWLDQSLCITADPRKQLEITIQREAPGADLLGFHLVSATRRPVALDVSTAVARP